MYNVDWSCLFLRNTIFWNFTYEFHYWPEEIWYKMMNTWSKQLYLKGPTSLRWISFNKKWWFGWTRSSSFKNIREIIKQSFYNIYINTTGKDSVVNIFSNLFIWFYCNQKILHLNTHSMKKGSCDEKFNKIWKSVWKINEIL